MITKTLELSTAHISRPTSELIEMQTNDIPVFYEKAEFGWWFPVLDSSYWPHTMPTDLKKVLEYAAAHDCKWVMFDRDCDEVDGLEVFEW